ncbi:MAG: hypothetical protein AABZ77_09825 [Chloroflexota bacterium]
MVKNRLTSSEILSYNSTMQAVEATLEELFKHNPEFLKACQRFGWGKIEIAVKDGKPVMVTVKRDIKLS